VAELTAYFISGLGADERAFQRIILPAKISIKHIKWIEPLAKEKFSHYVERLSSQIDPREEYILVGLSFGGMIAIEMAKFLSPKKVILLSSITNRKQLPWTYRLIGSLKLNLLIPGSLMKNSNFLVSRLFGIRKRKDMDLLREILKDTSPKYLYWSIDQILNWKNSFKPPNLYHIHGQRDNILPCRNANPNEVIPGAGHLMVFTHSLEVNKILSKVLDS
jgi:esterase/lipase